MKKLYAVTCHVTRTTQDLGFAQTLEKLVPSLRYETEPDAARGLAISEALTFHPGFVLSAACVQEIPQQLMHVCFNHGHN